MRGKLKKRPLSTRIDSALHSDMERVRVQRGINKQAFIEQGIRLRIEEIQREELLLGKKIPKTEET